MIDTTNIRITPRAKLVAERKGISYDTIGGTGQNDTITIIDIRNFLNGTGMACHSTYDSEKPPEIIKMSVAQRTIFKNMTASLQGTAQMTISTETDISALTGLYRKLKERYLVSGIKLSYTAILIKSIAMALENHPEVRAALCGDTEVRVSESIDIGCAVDIPNGLIVPVIRQANLKDLRQICVELKDLSERAKVNKLNSDELGNACMTITNLGMFGITYFTPILNAPESLILGVGGVIKKVIVRDGVLTPGSVINMSLTYDQRVINGAQAARFLEEVSAGAQNFKWF